MYAINKKAFPWILVGILMAATVLTGCGDDDDKKYELPGEYVEVGFLKGKWISGCAQIKERPNDGGALAFNVYESQNRSWVNVTVLGYLNDRNCRNVDPTVIFSEHSIVKNYKEDDALIGIEGFATDAVKKATPEQETVKLVFEVISETSSEPATTTELIHLIDTDWPLLKDLMTDENDNITPIPFTRPDEKD